MNLAERSFVLTAVESNQLFPIDLAIGSAKVNKEISLEAIDRLVPFAIISDAMFFGVILHK